MVASTLILFTHAYPFAGAEPFLATELPYLAERFARVILVPHTNAGACQPLPPNVEVDTSVVLPHRSAIGSLLASLSAWTSGALYEEVLGHPAVLIDPRKGLRAMHHLLKAQAVTRWMEAQIACGRIAPAETVCYTYWLAFQTTGLALLKRRYPEVRVVSRAHGWDIYADRHVPAYLPFRPQLLTGVDGIYAASDHGRAHLATRYPALAPRCHVAHLGTPDPHGVAAASTDGVLRIVTCASLVPVKRVPLFIAGLAAFAPAYPQQRVAWDHFGDGPELAACEAAAATLGPQVTVTLHGRIPNADVLAYYRTHPVDVFVNTSASEGHPVSIMEAQSFGIPTIATAVGGTPEMVQHEVNGVLLPAHPTPDEISTALARYRTPTPAILAQRDASRQIYQQRYRAAINYPAFVAQLLAMPSHPSCC